MDFGNLQGATSPEKAPQAARRARPACDFTGRSEPTRHGKPGPRPPPQPQVPGARGGRAWTRGAGDRQAPGLRSRLCLRLLFVASPRSVLPAPRAAPPPAFLPASPSCGAAASSIIDARPQLTLASGLPSARSPARPSRPPPPAPSPAARFLYDCHKGKQHRSSPPWGPAGVTAPRARSEGRRKGSRALQLPGVAWPLGDYGMPGRDAPSQLSWTLWTTSLCAPELHF